MSRSGSFIRYETRLAIYLRDGFVCVYCDARHVPLSLDHVRPGDGHAPVNLITCCVSCNSSKQARSVGAFTAAQGLNRATIWRRIKTRTQRPIEPYRHAIRQLLDQGLPQWMERVLGGRYIDAF